MTAPSTLPEETHLDEELFVTLMESLSSTNQMRYSLYSSPANPGSPDSRLLESLPSFDSVTYSSALQASVTDAGTGTQPQLPDDSELRGLSGFDTVKRSISELGTETAQNLESDATRLSKEHVEKIKAGKADDDEFERAMWGGHEERVNHFRESDKKNTAGLIAVGKEHPAARPAILLFANEMGRFFTDLWASISGWFGEIIRNIAHWMSAAWDKIKQFFSHAYGLLRSAFGF